MSAMSSRSIPIPMPSPGGIPDVEIPSILAKPVDLVESANITRRTQHAMEGDRGDQRSRTSEWWWDSVANAA